MYFQTTKSSEFILVQLDRSLTFPSVDYITDVIGKQAVRHRKNGLPIVIDCHHIQFADFTAAMVIIILIQHHFTLPVRLNIGGRR